MSVFTQQFCEGDAVYPQGAALRVAVKDSIDVAGAQTCLGSELFAEAVVAERHAEVVERLLVQNCAIVGKNTMHELAYGMTGINSWSGTAPNVFYPDLIPGGSSSGSAAVVAQGRVDFSLGTDTGGSVRVPAACCGVYGHKPTFGRVSRVGVSPAESSLDCVGPFAADAAGIKQAMQILLSDYQEMSVDLTALTVGLIDVKADDAIWYAINRCLLDRGVRCESKQLPSLDAAFTAGMHIINAENWAEYSDVADSPLLGADVRSRLLKAGDTQPEQIQQAEQIRNQFTTEVDQLLDEVDLLILPTLPHFPLSLEAARNGATDLNISRLVRPFNLSGHPALTIPLVAEGRRPAGMQLVGKKGCDELLCELACELSPFVSKPKKPNNNSVGF